MAGIAATQFNIFGSATQNEISVGYISSIRGYVQGVTICEANDYEKEYPNTAFILRNRDKVSYIGIDEVNALVPDDLLPKKDNDACSAVDLQHECSQNPEVFFSGGGGVGAFANPVLGIDGGVLTLDITNPGYGYQFPPSVEVKDECGFGKGSVVRVQVSDGDNCVESWKYYKDQMDDNQPDICDDTSVPYGRVWGVNGQDTGEWDPTKYSRYAVDPLMDEIDKYLENLKNLTNPWWTTRQDLNNQNINWSKSGKVTKVGYAVSVTEWSDFLNLYGISPVPPSDEPGSAHGGETFDFEWDIDFPWGGEYIFRGLYDGEIDTGDLYVDNQKIASLNRWTGLTEPIKYNVGIATSKKVSFKLHNGVITRQAPIQPSKETLVREAGGRFIKEGNNYFYKVAGNDLVDIDFDFFWDKSIDGKETPKPTIPERVQAKFQVYTSGGGDGLKFKFTAADGSHSFEINSDNYVHNDPAKDLFVNVKPNIDYNIVSSRRSGTTEQGCLREDRFGRRGVEKDRGTSKCIFCDKVGSRDDDDDLQVKTTDASGIFTAGGGISSGSSRHDSFAITYRYGGVAPVDNTPKERPAITKLTIQTEKDPLVFEIPKTDRQPPSTGGKQTPWVKSYQNDTNWVRNSNTAFLRSHAVFPVHDSSMNDVEKKGIWHINITTPGNYTIESQSDDTASIDWDSNLVGSTAWIEQRPKTFTIANVPVGIHKLGATVKNNGRYGDRWYNNPGGVAWILKDPSGTVVATSLSPFNDDSLANNLGKGGKDWQQKGIISKKGNFKNGRKYRVTFDRLPYTNVPVIGDTGTSPSEDDQKIDFFDKGHRKGNTLQIITPKNVIFSARNAYQLSKGDTIVVYDKGVKTKETSVFNTLKYIDKANRRLWKTTNKGGLLGKYGIAPYDTALALPNMPYAGNHEIIWGNINFPVSTNYNIDVHVDDDVTISIGDQVTFTKIGFTHGKDATTYDSFGDAVEAVGQGKFGHTGQTTHTYYIKAGTYPITAVLHQIPGGKWPTTNPMALAIDIKAKLAYKTVVDPKSWNENPMGVALSIEAPTPSPPPAIVPPVLAEGECPESPIWHTRMKPEGSPWYPVKFGYWHKWTNKYAISPIPPLNTPGTDGTGNNDGWKQTWKIDAPYEGEYTLKGTVDNFGWIEVNGNRVAERTDDPAIAFKDEEYKRSSLDVVVKPKDTKGLKWPQETKVYMHEGENTLTANVSNFKNYETKKKFFTEKIFSTKDWQSAAPVKTTKNNKPHGIIISKKSNKYYLTAYGNDIVDADLAYTWDALEGASLPPPPPKEQVKFMVYTSGGDNVGLKFAFTAADGSHSFEVKADDFVDNGPAVEISVNLKTNMTYNVLSSRRSGTTEQGLLRPDTFGRRGTERDRGTSSSIFCDKVGSADDDDDLQIQCKSGVFTAGGGISSGSSRHDSFAITYRFTTGSGASPNYTPPSVTKITVQTEKDPLVFEVPKTDAIPPTVTGPQKPWVKSHQNDTNWVRNNNTGFLRSHAVFPVHDSSKNGLQNKGTWHINITTPGNYTVDVQSDDTAKIDWDSNLVGSTAWIDQKVKTFTITNVPAGIHKLSATVRNNPKYGTRWRNNPGGVAWILKDPSGTVVASSLSPFNDSNLADNMGKGGDQWKVSGTIKQRGTFKAGKTYEVTFVKGYGRRPDGSAIINIPDPTIVESGWKTEEKKIIKPNPKMAFKSPWDRLETIDVYQMSSAIGVEELIIDNTRNGVTYSGPALYNFKHKSYGSWMNDAGISPDYPKTGGGETINYVWSNVNFPATGEYEFRFANDAHGSLYLDGQTVIDGDFDTIAGVSARDRSNWDPGLTRKMIVTKGNHKIAVAPKGRLGLTDVNADGLFRKLSEDYYRGQQAWDNNPSGMAVGITRLVEDKPAPGTPEAAAAKGKSWYKNPIGLCAILIPPPCKQIKCGKGRLKDPLVIDPGCGWPVPGIGTPTTPPGGGDPGIGGTSYPVKVIPVEVVIDDPGINYNGGDGDGGGDPDKPETDPPTELEFDVEYDPFGRVDKVSIGGTWLTSGDGTAPGITFTPVIRIPSKTGTNFKGHIRMEVIRDPIDAAPDELIQVTDLVGLKQTGYIEGRAYYGSIYYKNGIPYAGITETAGKAIQVYATLQESIDGERTTTPSAIQRQGTDVSSNDPRLNIPGTPDNLT
ncbi:MAG: hypothetical protein CMP62_06110 [Flavobacteriales bacterium]|nr:hypothetical protein [Flavobacteriales bacterium]